MRTTVFGRRNFKHARQWLVFLNGVEVTADCQMADSRLGRVLLLERDSDGRAYLRPDKTLARTWRHGRVELKRRDRAELRARRIAARQEAWA